MLYPNNQAASLAKELFRSPGAEYRAAPFWAWNCALEQETLNREIDYMKEMGFGGAHVHVRVGLETAYLSDEFMALVKNTSDYAARRELLTWLYDEDKWPSGFAGGLVTKDPRHRMKHLIFSPRPGPGACEAYAVTLDSAGCLEDYRRLQPGEALPEGAQARYAYLAADTPDHWFNGQTYVDTMSPAAIEEFIRVTHERYRECLGEEFGKTVPAIFTDEPNFGRKRVLPEPFSSADAQLPWTTDFAESYQAQYGEDILALLPELFLELPEGRVSQARWRYHDHSAARFAAAFADQVGRWCGENNIMLTGHMLMEESLRSQTIAVGDCMRSYRAFQLPGIDMLCDNREFNTAKQAQSAAHQYGRPGVLSELYGVTNWDFRFHRHKLQGDWQAALGVSVRVPHLYWVSMRGEAKRDYPASIGHQSPWFRQYPLVEDHFARLNTALTRGKPLVNIAVIHPVESYWLHWGPDAQTKALRDEMDGRYEELTEWLLFHQLDFDFICESLLPELYDPAGEGFAVGEMHYSAVLVPWLETIRRSTLEALRAFEAKGGQVIWMGEAPGYVDALPAQVEAACIPWSRTAVTAALEPQRLHSVSEDGAAADNLLSQWRRDGACRWLFLCHARDSERYFANKARALQIHIQGEWQAECYDTLTGEISPLPCGYDSGSTVIAWTAYAQDSLLLRLVPGKAAAQAAAAAPWKQVGSVAPVVPVTLEEPNVLLLDMPEFSLDGGPWEEREEVLRICDRCKETLGLDNEIAHGCQPWALQNAAAAAPKHSLRLRYRVQSQVEAEGITLAVEDMDTLQISWNGKAIAPKAEGYYIDEAFPTVTLGALHAGENLLEITLPFGKITTVESCYLLGDFGVTVRGSEAVITAPVRALAFGDWTGQGLPFYGGNVVYHTQLEASQTAQYMVEATHFQQPVLGVRLDGGQQRLIAFAPWQADLGTLTPGRHRLDIIAYGNRINTFGALHNYYYDERWYGPGAWRSKGCGWGYEYRLRSCGVMVAPRVYSKQ